MMSVQRVRRRICLKALARQVSFQPDQRFLLLQSIHPTQRLYTDPPSTLLIMAAIQAPGTTLTHPLSSPTKSFEQISYEGVTDRGSVVGNHPLQHESSFLELSRPWASPDMKGA
ncbi:hypothetical protein SLA2020_314190 [Shorea laevis]